MYIDNRIIARQSTSAGGLQVLAHTDAVHWPNGVGVHLHPVYANGLPMLTLRALATQGGHLQLFDLARLVRRLDIDLRTCPKRDVPGMVLFTLRQAFASAELFTAAVQRISTGTWWPVDVGYVWQAAARAVDLQVLQQAACDAPYGAAPVAQSQWCPA